MHVLLTFLLGVLASAQAMAWCEQPLRLNVGDWPPYMYRLADGGAGGIDVDVVQQMAKRAGCRLVYTAVPPERAHPMLESGEIDILMAASDLPARHRYAWFSRAYRDEVMAVLAPAAAGPRDIPALLAGQASLLAPRFGWYGAAYEPARPLLQKAGRLYFYEDYRQGVAMLAAKRAGLLLGDERALRLAAGQQGMTLHTLFETNRSPVHLMFSRARFSRADVDRLDAALAGGAGANR